MKHQLKHRTIVSNGNFEAIERIKQDQHRPERNEQKIQFNFVVKELKVIFQGDNFNYHDVLKPITPREEPEEPTLVLAN